MMISEPGAVRAAGNVCAALALAMLAPIGWEWLTGWQAYCWLRGQMAGFAALYGITFGFAGFLAAVFRRFKLAAALFLPAIFPILWDVLMREIGFTPACVLG